MKYECDWIKYFNYYMINIEDIGKWDSCSFFLKTRKIKKMKIVKSHCCLPLYHNVKIIENMNDCLFIFWWSKSEIQWINQKTSTQKSDDWKWESMNKWKMSANGCKWIIIFFA